jgi:hypothetical protein
VQDRIGQQGEPAAAGVPVAKQEPPHDTKPTVEVAPPAPTIHDTWIKAIALLPLDQHAAALPAIPLDDIRLTPKNITQGLDVLRDMKSLKTIGITHTQAWPTAEF